MVTETHTSAKANLHETPSLYWTYNQNNSGGVFDLDEYVCHYVIIEARDKIDADRRAQSVGIYFDGVEAGWDCDCCGDRWCRAWEDGSNQPEIYGNHPREYGDRFTKKDGVFCRVYHLDGSISEYKK